jgi:hypothetical protein
MIECVWLRLDLGLTSHPNDVEQALTAMFHKSDHCHRTYIVPRVIIVTNHVDWRSNRLRTSSPLPLTQRDRLLAGVQFSRLSLKEGSALWHVIFTLATDLCQRRWEGFGRIFRIRIVGLSVATCRGSLHRRRHPSLAPNRRKIHWPGSRWNLSTQITVCLFPHTDLGVD